MKIRHIIIGISIGISFMGCTSDTRQNYRIPPLPNLDRKHQIETGIAFLTDAVRKSPRSANIYFKRAELLTEQKNYSAALTDLNEALDITPNNGNYLFARAKIQRQLKQFDKALADARRAEVLGEDTPQLYTILGDLTQQKSQYRDARLYLNKTLQMAPYQGEAYFYSGTLAAKQGDTTSAIALIQQSMELKPRFLGNYVELTNIYTRLKVRDEALRYNNIGLRYFPQESQLHYTRGFLYHTDKHLDSALVSYKKAMFYDSSNYLANFQAGLIYLKWGNNLLAISNFEKVARQSPKFASINLLLGMAFERAGNLDKAIEQFTVAIERNPSDWKIKGKLYAAQRRNSYYKQYGYYPSTSNDSLRAGATQTATANPDSGRIIMDIPSSLEIKSKIDTTKNN
jgi:tetratricopeptide (TPR) repeat protein